MRASVVVTCSQSRVTRQQHSLGVERAGGIVLVAWALGEGRAPSTSLAAPLPLLLTAWPPWPIAALYHWGRSSFRSAARSRRHSTAVATPMARRTPAGRGSVRSTRPRSRRRSPEAGDWRVSPVPSPAHRNAACWTSAAESWRSQRCDRATRSVRVGAMARPRHRYGGPTLTCSRVARRLRKNERHEIPMLMLHERSPRDLKARDQLSAVLPDAEISAQYDVGSLASCSKPTTSSKPCRRSGMRPRRRGPTTTSSSLSIRTSQGTGGSAATGPAVSESLSRLQWFHPHWR
jgi:hypothetical protein